MDAFYTPPVVVRKLVVSTTIEEVLYVADFAAGNGELLRAAKTIWPDANYVACELDSAIANSLRSLYHEWHVYEGDFMGAPTERLSLIAMETSLMLLIQPFTDPGASR